MARLMNTLGKTVAALAALGVAYGCSTTDTREPTATPTHRWVSEIDVSRAKYNFDNRRCAEDARVDVGATPKSAPAFVDYERCMEERGYRLATYAPIRYPGRHP